MKPPFPAVRQQRKSRSRIFITGRSVFPTGRESGVRGGIVVFFDFGQVKALYKPLIALAILVDFLEKLFHLRVGKESIQVVLGVGE